MARRPEPLKELEEEILSLGGKVIAIPGDVSKPEEVEKAIQLTVKKFGALHLAVNNAAISGHFGLLHETTIENWKKVMGINLDGIFYGMKYQIQAMLKNSGGSIVNIGSVEGTYHSSYESCLYFE
ncbi:unnamed protein product [Sphagnum jensenii]|uniref:Uncharacterized protein n=2 Tax=Sphagnum jensenii TaxID=128206 RepID=A0ABP0VJ15_9BRYO